MDAHGPFLASLCSHDAELTARVPVLFSWRGHPIWSFFGVAHDGVGDRLVIWCADCGGHVREHKLAGLVAIKDSVATVFDLPVVSMVGGRAEA